MVLQFFNSYTVFMNGYKLHDEKNIYANKLSRKTEEDNEHESYFDPALSVKIKHNFFSLTLIKYCTVFISR